MRPVMIAAVLVNLTFLAGELLAQSKQIAGAWEFVNGDIKMTKIFTDQFFSVAIYNVKDKQFIATAGGRWEIDGNTLIETFEFNTNHPDRVGQLVKTPIGEIKNNTMTLLVNNQKEEWKKIDDGTPGKLAGAWLITGRMNDGKLQPITPGARRTMKILSGTRFQWIAYNTETREFFGTGGGTYTSENGKYIESILFFSRDNSRVGANLQFDFSLEDGNWRHKGFSSKGDPIDEVWTRREKVGL